MERELTLLNVVHPDTQDNGGVLGGQNKYGVGLGSNVNKRGKK